MANTKRNKSGYYERTLTTGHRINDAGNVVPVRKRFYGKTLKELNQKIEEYRDAKRQGIENRKQSFGVLADAWLREFFLMDGSLKDSTKQLYISAWRRTIKPLPFYSERLDHISARRIQAAYNKLLADGTPVSTIKACHKLMKRLFRYLEREGLARNITGSLTLPSENKGKNSSSIVVWSDEEIKTIFGGFDDADYRFRLRFLLVLAFFSGCRKSELLALQYDDIEIHPNGTVSITVNKTLSEVTDGMSDGVLETHVDITPPKSNASIRTIPVDPCVAAELAIHEKWHKEEMLRNRYRTDFIFTTDSGNFYNRKNIDHALNRYYRQIGITEPKTLHCYRHTYATRLCQSGVPIQTASSLLGHADISTTARFYVGVSEEAKQEAALTLRHILEA